MLRWIHSEEMASNAISARKATPIVRWPAEPLRLNQISQTPATKAPNALATWTWMARGAWNRGWKSMLASLSSTRSDGIV